MKHDYQNGDIYHALAKMCGLTDDTDIKRWKKEHPDVRQRMKSLQLGISYGMGVPSLARGLDRHPLIASEIILLHKRTYPRFWEWREQLAQAAMLDRRMETVFGWPLHISNSAEQEDALRISRCRATARKCCAWRRCGCAMPALSRACWCTTPC